MDGKWMADLLDFCTAFHQNGPTAYLPSRPTDRPDHHPPQSEEEETNPNLSRTLPTSRSTTTSGDTGRYQNIPASDTKLMHRLGIYSIGPPLTMDKLIPFNSTAIMSPSEMGPFLDIECKPAVIIKQRFILVTHTDHLS